MWLVHTKDFSLKQFRESDVPRYAILSHTWEDEEVSFQDMQAFFNPKRKSGWAKIKGACEQAVADRLNYIWMDTCCIDKSSSAELQEAINSMYRWYKNAEQCYVFLSDVSYTPSGNESAATNTTGVHFKMSQVDTKQAPAWRTDFMASRWFTRGWTQVTPQGAGMTVTSC